MKDVEMQMLGDAIEHTQEVIKDLEKEVSYGANCYDCLNDHVQLLKWLKELKDYKRKDQNKGGEQC